jgi:hypothetical protein
VRLSMPGTPIPLSDKSLCLTLALQIKKTT